MPDTDQSSPAMSVADLLDAVDLRGRTWCYVDLSDTGGYSVRPSDAALLHIVLTGQVVLARTGGEAIRLTAGEGVIVTSGEAHAIRASSVAAIETLDFLSREQNVDIPPSIRLGRSGSYCARVLSARMRMTCPENLSLAALPAVLRLQPGEAPGSALDPALLPRHGVGPGATVVLTKLASAMLAEAMRREFFNRRTKDVAMANPLEQASELVRLNPGRNWTVETLARAVGMGRSNFSAQFGRSYEKSPMEFVTDVRMKRAAELLRQGNLPIQEIGELVGYACEPAFNRRFSKHFGVTPGAMRTAATTREEPPPAMARFSLVAGGSRTAHPGG